MTGTLATPSWEGHSNNTAAATELEDFGLLKLVIDILSNYAWIIPVTLGIPGNILSIIVATRKRNRNLSPCVYIVAMAVIDTAQLVQVAWFYPFFFSEVGRAILRPRDTVFKCFLYMTSTFGMQSGFFQAAMSVDRLIAVQFPMAAPRLCTTSRARKIVVILFTVLALVNLNIFYTVKYVMDPVSGVEFLMVSVPGGENLALLVSGCRFILGTLFPFIIISVCNIFIIIGVRKASIKRSKMDAGHHLGNETRKEKDTQYLTRMMILVSTAYIMTSMPYRCYLFMMDIPGVADHYDLTKTYWNLRYTLELWFVYDLWCCNYAINFYLYCLGGGKRYRQDIKEVFQSFGRCLVRRKNGEGLGK